MRALLVIAWALSIPLFASGNPPELAADEGAALRALGYLDFGEADAQPEETGARLPDADAGDRGYGFEVTEEGRRVWEFHNPRTDPKNPRRRGTIVRMIRHAPEFIEAIEARYSKPAR